MKPAITLLFLFFCLGTNAQSADETAIMKLLQRQTVGWNHGNVDEFMKGYWNSDSLMFVEGNGLRYGYRPALENYRKNYPDTVHMGKLNFTIIKMDRLSTDYYLVIGKYFLRRSVGDAGGTFSLLLRRIKGEWQIILDHTSAAKLPVAKAP